MNHLVDANVVIKWFVETERFRAEARTFLSQNFNTLEAPDLLLIEIANVVRRKFSLGEISERQAYEIIPAVRDYIPSFHPTAEFVDRALEIALELNHSVYDCIYLACAEATGRILVTDDGKLRRKVVGTPFDPFVRLLVDVQ